MQQQEDPKSNAMKAQMARKKQDDHFEEEGEWDEETRGSDGGDTD